MKSADLARAGHVADERLARACAARTSSASARRGRRQPRGGARGRCAASTPRSCRRQPRPICTRGLGEWLFLGDRYGAAAELFDAALGRADALGRLRPRPGARTGGRLRRSSRAGDTHAPRDDLPADRRSDGRGAARAARDRPRPPTGSAAARSLGDLDRAWTAAIAAGLRARGAGQWAPRFGPISTWLVQTAIIPGARASLSGASRDTREAIDVMTAEWEHLKSEWK